MVLESKSSRLYSTVCGQDQGTATHLIRYSEYSGAANGYSSNTRLFDEAPTSNGSFMFACNVAGMLHVGEKNLQ